MRQRVLLFCVGALLCASAWAQPEQAASSAQLARIGELIRSNRIDVGGEYSMREETGRFHVIHADKMMMDCASCHQGDRYRSDFLMASREKPHSQEAGGRSLRSVCLGCHQKGGPGTRWYNTSTE